VEITCGSARFTLPTMPVEDYPTLPEMPETAGTVEAGPFAAAVAQVAVAAGRDDTLPMLTGVRVELEGEKLTLLATDRYRRAGAAGAAPGRAGRGRRGGGAGRHGDRRGKAPRPAGGRGRGRAAGGGGGGGNVGFRGRPPPYHFPAARRRLSEGARATAGDPQ